VNPYAPPNAEPAAPRRAAPGGLGVFLWILNATAPRGDAALTAGVSFGFLAVVTLAVGRRWKVLL
jgi:hypothetical protein